MEKVFGNIFFLLLQYIHVFNLCKKLNCKIEINLNVINENNTISEILLYDNSINTFPSHLRNIDFKLYPFQALGV